MTSDTQNCSVYNEANQLKQVKNCTTNQLIAEYVYDYNGNRIEKKNYQNGQLIATVYSPEDEYETKKIASTGATQNTTYYFANDQLIAKKNPDGSKNYYSNDHLGSASVVTDQNGTVVEQTAYDPWGNITSGGTNGKYQYTGQEKDSETGLDYYNARYYNPAIQHFTQADTLVADAYNPQTLNRYSYVQNNPIAYTDPSGNHGLYVVDPNKASGEGDSYAYFQDGKGLWHRTYWGPIDNSYLFKDFMTVHAFTPAEYRDDLVPDFNLEKARKDLGKTATFFSYDTNTKEGQEIGDKMLHASQIRMQSKDDGMQYNLLENNCKIAAQELFSAGGFNATQGERTVVPNERFFALGGKNDVKLDWNVRALTALSIKVPVATGNTQFIPSYKIYEAFADSK